MSRATQLLSLALTLLIASPAFADVCPNCAGTGKMISGFSVKDCSRCGGTGVVNSGGIPTPNVPSMGYQTNKFELKAQTEQGGWVVAWAEDVTETDTIQGVVAAGVSVVSENPGPFYLWVETLVDRTIDSMAADAKARFPGAILGQVRNLAADAIKAAVTGRRGNEVLRNYDTVDFKAGAIMYSGRNFIGNNTVSRTWGLKPYVAFRWRGSASGGISPSFIGARYFYFNSPHYWANVSAIVVDEGYFTEVANGRWVSEGWSKRATDGQIVNRSQSQEYFELHRGPDGVVIKGTNTVPIKLTSHGQYVFRDYPTRPVPPGINPNQVTWWFNSNGRFVPPR